jgi:hypothetical protein
MSAAHHENDEGRVSNIMQALFGLLFLHPDDTEIPIPRTWLAALAPGRSPGGRTARIGRV